MPAIRLIVLSYVPLFFIGAAVGNLLGQDVLRGLPLLPAALYLAFRFGTAVIEGRMVRWTIEPQSGMKALIILYAVLYSFLFFPRAYPGAVGIASVPTLIIHAAFWILVFSDPEYRDDPLHLSRDIVLGVVSGFMVGLLLTFQAAGWNVRPGAIHNLSATPFVRSDVDVPILITVLTFLAVGWVMRTGDQENRGGDRYRWRRLAVTGVGIFLVAMFTFYLYSRRTPILAVMAGVGVMLLPIRLRRRMVYVIPVIALAPLGWEVLARILLRLTQNPIISAILVRNDPETYLTATNRLVSWQGSFDFLMDVRIQHLWGYGGSEVAGIFHEHAHNMVLQMVFDAGLITAALAVVLIFKILLILGDLLERPDTRREGSIMMGLFVAWLVLGAVEPTLRQFSMGHLLFLTLAAYAANRIASPPPVERDRAA
jgi:hypothetical protein